MLRNCLFMLLRAVLILVGGLLSESLLPKAISQWSHNSVEEVIFDRIYCRQLVVVENKADAMGEFKGTLVSPTKISIHKPGFGKARYSYDDVYIHHPKTGQEISIGFDGGFEAKGIK